MALLAHTVYHSLHLKHTKKQTPWLESARELYRPSDHRVSAKLVPTLAGRGVSRSWQEYKTVVTRVIGQWCKEWILVLSRKWRDLFQKTARNTERCLVCTKGQSYLLSLKLSLLIYDIWSSRQSWIFWRMMSSGMWRHVDLVRTDVSKERVASIFRVENSAREQAASYPLTLFLEHRFSTLKMEVTRSSET
jgi:hypothetical protein